jgi:hypothetical protein
MCRYYINSIVIGIVFFRQALSPFVLIFVRSPYPRSCDSVTEKNFRMHIYPPMYVHMYRFSFFVAVTHDSQFQGPSAMSSIFGLVRDAC